MWVGLDHAKEGGAAVMASSLLLLAVDTAVADPQHLRLHLFSCIPHGQKRATTIHLAATESLTALFYIHHIVQHYAGSKRAGSYTVGNAHAASQPA